MNVVVDGGKVRNAEDTQIAEHVIDLRKKGDIWEVIEFLVHVWGKRFPDEQEALRIDIKEQREDLADAKFGQTTGGQDMERRLTLIFPLRLQSMIRTIYNREELPFDSKFYREFAKRYRSFQIPEKL